MKIGIKSNFFEIKMGEQAQHNYHDGNGSIE